MSEDKRTKKSSKMIGNAFWKLRSKHGRDKIFSTPEMMWEAACEYFQWCDENPFQQEDFIKSGDFAGDIVYLNKMRPYTLQGLCLYLDVHTKYFNEFENNLDPSKSDLDKGFSHIITHIRETIYDQKFTGAASGFFNANIIARDLGLVDKKQNELRVEQPLFPDEI